MIASSGKCQKRFKKKKKKKIQTMFEKHLFRSDIR